MKHKAPISIIESAVHQCIKKLLGIIEWIDFSEAMLKQAKLISNYILNGKVRPQKGECSRLPYENESFDKLCSTNTLYFWKEPDKYFREMLRVLKNGERL